MTNKPSKEDIHCGQVIYTEKSLRIYDLLVTKFSNRFVWKCPRKVLINHFKKNITRDHLDIGVGTGYFLQQLDLKPNEQRIGLLDLNEHCLDLAKQNLSVFKPEIYKQDIFESFTGISKKFDSVSINYILHCLPGTIPQKAIAFDHIKEVLNPGGILFGSTILGKGVKKNWLANKLLGVYNHKKFFDNLNDDYETLVSELKKRFSKVDVKVKGCVALFVVR